MFGLSEYTGEFSATCKNIQLFIEEKNTHRKKNGLIGIEFAHCYPTGMKYYRQEWIVGAVKLD